MGIFDSILDNTVGRIPVVVGAFSDIGKLANPVVDLFSGIAGRGMKMATSMSGIMDGLVNTLTSPTFMYLAIGGLGLGAIYILTKSDGSSKISPRPSSYISTLAKLTPQGRMAGVASAFI